MFILGYTENQNVGVLSRLRALWHVSAASAAVGGRSFGLIPRSGSSSMKCTQIGLTERHKHSHCIAHGVSKNTCKWCTRKNYLRCDFEDCYLTQRHGGNILGPQNALVPACMLESVDVHTSICHLACVDRAGQDCKAHTSDDSACAD